MLIARWMLSSPPDTLEGDLREIFSAYGSVSKINMPIDRETVCIVHTVNTVILYLFNSNPNIVHVTTM